MQSRAITVTGDETVLKKNAGCPDFSGSKMLFAYYTTIICMRKTNIDRTISTENKIAATQQYTIDDENTFYIKKCILNDKVDNRL